MLARCGLWPTFPDRDSGTSAIDASDAVDRHDVRTDDASLPDIRDVPPPDMGVDSGFGFMTCRTMPSTGPFALTAVANIPGGTRDLAFDGLDKFVSASTVINSYDLAGASTPLVGSSLGFAGRGIRYLPNGDIAVVTTEQSLLVYSSTLNTVSTIARGFSYLNGLAVDPTGAMYFSDTALGGAMPAVRRASDASSTATITPVTMGVQVPTGLVFTPDYRHLFIGSAGHGVYYIDLAGDGTAIGLPHVYLTEPVNAYGMAFDECGYLYVSDADRGRILRIPPGGGSFAALAYTAPDGGTITPVGIAFGQNPFDRTSLYFVDLSAAAVYRMPVGVQGATIVVPH